MTKYIKHLFACVAGVSMTLSVCAQFVHPGGLHTIDDLNRMKEKVSKGEHPWIEGWNELVKDPLAQNSHTPSPFKNMGDSRQKASIDAHAAYLNAIRWYISGDDSYARCAINICNSWSSTVNQIPSGNEISGLGGIATAEFALAAEVLRVSKLWKKKDFERFKDMMLNYLYPVCRNFLLHHNGAAVDYYWANWDICNIAALVAIGVLCDNEDIYNEGIHYYKHGNGNGNITNIVPYIHPNNTETGLGQWQESGRDQEHAQLGVGLVGNICQIAWNQGDDLYGYDNNRLLAGAEYVAQHNLMKDIPFYYYNNSQGLNHRWPAINGLGQLKDRPIWEMIYNHYAVIKGLPAPNSKLMAELLRPEHGSKDHFGYGTLVYTLESSAYPPLAIPSVPEKLLARGSVGKVFLEWEPSAGNTACGYSIQRSVSGKNNFVEIASYIENTINKYIDSRVVNNTEYEYRVAAINKTGMSDYSKAARATPVEGGSLPQEWTLCEVGSNKDAKAAYADINGGSFVIEGCGTAIGGNSDDFAYVYQKVNDNSMITCRIHGVKGAPNSVGVMMRETLNQDSKAVTMMLGHWGGRFARMGSRLENSGKMNFEIGNTYTWLPAWFRLKRDGNMFYAYESPDGINWFYVNSVIAKVAEEYYVGIVISSGDNAKYSRVEFDNISVVK